MITKAHECTLRVFENCLFKNDYSGLDGGGAMEFERIYSEFIDLSGLSETKEYSLLCAIHNLQLRIDKIKGMIGLQRTVFASFSRPFTPGLNDFKKYGHRLKWDPERPQDFLKQLDLVVIKEKSFESELDMRVKELADHKKRGNRPDGLGRIEYVKKLNSLNKEGYKIQKDETTVEELALMIKEQSDAILAEANRRKPAFA